MLTRLTEALRRLFADEGSRPPVCALRSFPLTVRCGRCGEIIRLRIDRDHELQAVWPPDAEEGDEPLELVLRKEIVGDACQNLIRFTLHFDCHEGLISSEIEGGEFVEDEWTPLCARTVPEERSTS